MAEFRMHFIVPSVKPVANAPHMVSGEPSGALPLASALRQQIGHQGQAFRCACSDKIILGEQHRGTGEHYGLLALIGGQPCIDDSACPACVNSKEFQEALEKFKAENDGRFHPNQPLPEQIVAKSAGCC